MTRDYADKIYPQITQITRMNPCPPRLTSARSALICVNRRNLRIVEDERRAD